MQPRPTPARIGYFCAIAPTLASFLSDSGAIAGEPLPYLAAGSSYTGGLLTFSGGGMYFGPYRPALPDVNVLTLGFEDFNVDSSSNLYSFGFKFLSPTTNSIPLFCAGTYAGCYLSFGTPCTDSTFTLTLIDGSTEVGSWSFFAEADDISKFVGITSTTAFNRIEIRESSTCSDVNGQACISGDQFFGPFYLSEGPSSPEPASIGLGIVGLVAICGSSRFRRRPRTQVLKHHAS